MSHITYTTFYDRPCSTMRVGTFALFILFNSFFFSDTKPCRSCLGLFHSDQIERAGLTAPFQIAFLGQRLFLFRWGCGRSHGEATGPKVSLSVIPILHCKQSGCLLPRFVPDTETTWSAATNRNKQTKKKLQSMFLQIVFGLWKHLVVKPSARLQSKMPKGGRCVSLS